MIISLFFKTDKTPKKKKEKKTFSYYYKPQKNRPRHRVIVTTVDRGHPRTIYKEMSTEELAKIDLSPDIRQCRVLLDGLSDDDTFRLGNVGFQPDHRCTRVLVAGVQRVQVVHVFSSGTRVQGPALRRHRTPRGRGAS